MPGSTVPGCVGPLLLINSTMNTQYNEVLTSSSIFMQKLEEYAFKGAPSLSSHFRTSSTESHLIPFNFSNLSCISISLSHYFVSTTNNPKAYTERDSGLLASEKTTQFPLFFRGYNSIKVPNKTEGALRRFVSKKNLKSIHDDPEVAIELCLVFLSNLTDTHFRILGLGFNDNAYNQAGWKSLSSEILRSQFYGPMTYKKIINVLLEGTKNGPILECDEKDLFGQKCYGYRLGEAYRMKGVSNYELKTDYVRNMQKDRINGRIKHESNNPICGGLIELCPLIYLPNYDEVLDHGIQLSRNGHLTKKGKKLTHMNNNARNYFKNPKERSFVEDNMDIYKYLTEGGLMIPTAGGDKSGGRIVDSFTLMPSWQRALLKIEGEEICTVDYSCLHPNIGISEYKGSIKYLTHDYVSTRSGIEPSTVKIEHLSFFNKRYEEMLKSPLWNYYAVNEADMLGKIVQEKGQGFWGHKETSRKLFGKEVQIMMTVFEATRRKGIPVGYIYDALFCKVSDAQEVKKIMDEAAIQHGVFTTAKIEF